VVEWIHQVFQEQDWRLNVLCLAIQILDSFLELSPVKLSQFQLATVSCVSVAAKQKRYPPINASILIEYSAKSITLPEVQAWELLVLSKLSWHINFVELSNYFDSFWRLSITSFSSSSSNNSSPSGRDLSRRARKESYRNAHLLFILASRDWDFCHLYQFRVRSLVALRLALTTCQSQKLLAMQKDSSGFKACWESPDLHKTLKVTGELIESCSLQMESILWNMVPPSSPKSNPCSSKSEHLTSTPKKKPGCWVFEDDKGPEEVEESQENKENDDSAIGLIVGSPQPHCITTSPTVSSTVSSSTSSPDSGTSMAPKRTGAFSDLTSLENILSSTAINPLDKNE
ncbi:hypothetical protein TCAL_15783, partial [Tigriopus californicus]